MMLSEMLGPLGLIGGVWYIALSVGFVAAVANGKGRSFVGWGLLALFVTPLLALLALAALPSVPVREYP
jgi:hypothetical protein